MRISDWSSDVCSSDLPLHVRHLVEKQRAAVCLLEGADLADAVAFEQARLDAEQLRLQAVGVHGGAVQRDEGGRGAVRAGMELAGDHLLAGAGRPRSEEHTSELQSLMRISYAVFCLKQKKPNTQ